MAPRRERRYQSLLIKNVASKEKINTDAALGNHEIIVGMNSKKRSIKPPIVVPIALPIFLIFLTIVSCPLLPKSFTMLES